MELNSIEIKGLFGYFDHEIIFGNNDLSIITAPNGYGKTVILNIIQSIFDKKFSYLLNLEFSEITVNIKNEQITFEKENSSTIKIKSNKKNKKEIKIDRKKYINNLSMVNSIRALGFIERIGRDEWLDSKENDIIDTETVVNRYSIDIKKDDNNWFDKVVNKINIYMIKDQRLFYMDLKKMRLGSRWRNEELDLNNSIEKYSHELSASIRDCGLKSQRKSQDLDSSFPNRLIDKSNKVKSLGKEELFSELDKLQKKRLELSDLSLLSSDNNFDPLNDTSKLDINDDDLKVLTLYVNDTKEKLDAYNDLYQKVQLFVSLLNEKKLSFKKIKIDIDKGFKFVTLDEKDIELKKLSSGEQNQVVILYDLIFNVKKNYLVLIDEPEISLHIAWQEEFLSDIEKIQKINNMQVIISTHSPQIINGRWELVTSLYKG